MADSEENGLFGIHVWTPCCIVEMSPGLIESYLSLAIGKLEDLPLLIRDLAESVPCSVSGEGGSGCQHKMT